MISPRFFLILVVFIVMQCVPALATGGLTEQPVEVVGGLSPDGKLAVVVFGNVNWDSSESLNASERESHAYLYDEISKRIIGPLEEVDVTGGTWGKTQSNIHAIWSPNGHYLAVASRCGRLMYCFVVYRMDSLVAKGHRSNRAVPQKLGPNNEGPNGRTLFQGLRISANPGSQVEGWTEDNKLKIVSYGWRPKSPESSMPPLFTDDGLIRLIYFFHDDNGTVEKYEKPSSDY